MARRSLNDQMSALAQRRSQAQEEIDRAGLEIGATATYLRDVLDQPKARSAEYARLSPSHMTELMRTAAEQNVSIGDPLSRIPFLARAELQAHLNKTGGAHRIIASFSRSDPLYMSGIDPSALVDKRYGQDIHLPHMLIQSGDGDWVAVDNVNVGYGGTGPSNAFRELSGLGLSPELARSITASRVSDVNLDNPDDALLSSSWPHVHLDAPSPLADFFVVVLPTPTENRLPRMSVINDAFRRAQRQRTTGDAGDDGYDYTEGGFYPTRPIDPPLTRWLEKLDSGDAPNWLCGQRRARVYLDRETAREHGFSQESRNPWGGPRAVYPVIIEQGRLQLWLSIPTSNDPTILFTPEIYDALDQAGFYTTEYRERDEQGAFWRWLRSHGSQRPAMVDMDDRPLVHDPSAQTDS